MDRWPARETMQLPSFKNASGLDSSSAPVPGRGFQSGFTLPSGRNPYIENPPADLDTYPPELRGLIAEAATVRRRIVANRSLDYWLLCCGWILGALILAAAVSQRSGGEVVLAVILIVVSGVASLALARRKGPSFYGAACQLDALAGLEDRLSTTIYFAGATESNSMILRQRRDALARLNRVDGGALFPIRMPARARWTGAMVLLAAGLFVYRAEYGPPALSLIHIVGQTHLTRTFIAPLVRVAESSPLNLLQQRKPDVLDEEAEAAAVAANAEQKDSPMPPPDNPMGGNSDDTGAQNSVAFNPTNSRPNPDSARNRNQGPSSENSPTGAQQESQPKDGSQQTGSKSASNAKTPGNSQGQPSSEGSKSAQQSLGQKLMQALKTMMGDMTGKETSESAGQQTPDTQGPSGQGQGSQSAQSMGKGAQQGTLNDGKAQETPANSGAHSGVGNGTQQQTAKLPEGQSPAQQSSANLVPERVQLDASDFRVQTRPRALAGPGSADVPLTNALPSGPATTNGSEQQDIPLRYREYVQHYFDQQQK